MGGRTHYGPCASDLDNTTPLSADDTTKTCIYMVLRRSSLVHSTRIGRFLGNCSHWRRSTTGARRRMSPRLRRITLRFLLMGQPVHEEKRCRGWADGTSKSSSWRAAAAGRMSTLIVIAGHHTRHATLPHFSTFTFVCAQNHQPVENGRQFSFVLRSTYLSKTIQGF